MQIRIEWIKAKDYMIGLLGCCLLLSSYTLLIAEDAAQAESLVPRFVVSRIASFDFFGEPEIEVIIDAAEPIPPAGSEIPINPNDVIDMVEGSGGDRYEANLESDPFPSVTLSEELMRLSPESGFSNNSRFNEGDRRTLQQKLRAFSGGNSDPRPLPDFSENETSDPLQWINQSELLQSSQSRVIERQSPDFVPLLNFAITDIIDTNTEDEGLITDNGDEWQDHLVVDGPSLNVGNNEGADVVELPTTNNHDAFNEEGELPIEDSNEPLAGYPGQQLPISDVQYLSEYWQEELGDGFYVQIFATLQPLMLREQIERQQGQLPLVITATHGRLGMMNRLLVGPLKADELGAVEHQLRLRGVRDYFLITAHART